MRPKCQTDKAMIQVTTNTPTMTKPAVMAFCRERVAPYKRIRRVEFGDLPKTISGKIRRVELRAQETTRQASPSDPITPNSTTKTNGTTLPYGTISP
jgi:acyl-coenzyme A synthetase/AMP-(fatty) acid ligase